MSSIKINLITNNEIASKCVEHQPDRLTGSPNENKRVFDELPKLIATKFNNTIETLDSIVDSQSDSIKDNKSAMNVLSARMDEFASLPDGSTSGNAELIDIRVSADGTTCPTAGDAIRGQVSDLKSDFTHINKTWYAGKIASTGKGFVSTSGVITANNNYKYAKYIPKDGAVKVRVDSLYVPASQSSLAVFAFFDNSDRLIKVVRNTDINTEQTQRVFTNVEANVPSRTAYVLITFANMSSSTSYDTISEYGFYTPAVSKRAFNQHVNRDWNQQFYMHIATSQLGDYSSLAFNAKIKTSQPVLKYDVYFVGYDEDYSNRVIAMYHENLTKGINGNEITIAENFQNTAKSIKSRYWNGVLINLYYAQPSQSTALSIRMLNRYAIVTDYCVLNDNPLELAQYPSAGFYVTSKEYHEPYNPMLGGYLCAIGDSLTAVYYKSEPESWVSLIAQWNNMRYENLGISGNPMAKIASYTENKCMAERVDDLDPYKFYTHIFVMGGTNDYNFSIPIGENTDTAITTFKGAVNHIISTLTNKFPQAKIVFGTTYRRNANYLDKPYADAMLEVCKLHSIPCLNNYENSGVQFFDSEWMSIFGAANALGNNHLNASGDLFVAPRFEHALKYGIQ